MVVPSLDPMLKGRIRNVKRSRLHSMNRPRRDAPFALHWDRLRPDLLVVGLRFEPGGLSQYLGVTAHKLALHASCNILGIR